MKRLSSARRGAAAPAVRRAVSVAVESLEQRRLFAYDYASTIFQPTADPNASGDFRTGQALFGSSVATSGNLAVITAPTAGAGTAYLFDLSNPSAPAHIGTFENPDAEQGDQFGAAVAIVNGKVAITAPESFTNGTGKVYLYDLQNPQAAPAELLSPYTGAGMGVGFGASITAAGNSVFVSVANAQGGVEVVRYDIGAGADSTWDDIYAIGEYNFSTGTAALAVKDGMVLATGFDGANPLVYQINPATDAVTTRYTGAVEVDPFDESLKYTYGTAIAVTANSVLVSSPASNKVFEYFDNNTVREITAPPGSGSDGWWAGFGFSLAVNGDKLLVGNRDAHDLVNFGQEGEAYVFSLATGAHLQTLQSPTVDWGDDFAHAAAALPNGGFLITDPFDPEPNAGQAGAAYVFVSDEPPPPTNTAPANAAIAAQGAAVRSQAVAFTGSFADVDIPNGDTHTITWDFGDNTTATGLNVSHAFATAGTHAVTMTVTDAAGASTTATCSVTVSATLTQNNVLYVGGTDGNDTIAVTKAGVTVNGVLVPLTGGVVVYGGAGADTITVSPSVYVALEAHGGAGDDSISGGSGNDVLVGGDGNDVLYGGAGRDLLIGGDGADRVYGEVNDDILIAPATVYDNDWAKLNEIMAVWTGSATFADRVATLRGGLLTAGEEVHSSDGAIDILTGKNGDDWFIYDSEEDLATDIKSGDASDDLAFVPTV